jgi:transcriptional regulator with XRE-family HTH domain
MKERLLELRKYLKMNQTEFAERLGMSQSTYSPLETGRDIRDAYVILICQAYSVNEVWFRTGEGEMFSDKPDYEQEELLRIYDRLPPPLRKYLLTQARALRELQSEMNG